MLAAFLAGAAAYPMVELAWRGRTHPAMALAGGVSLSMLRGLSRVQKSRPLWQQALLGGLMITGMEYAFGLAFNRRHQIWDYRRMPANLRGQICLPFTLAWCGLALWRWAACACSSPKARGPEYRRCSGWRDHRRRD